MSEQLSKDEDDFIVWKDHPVTQKLFRYCKGIREARKEDWACAGFMDASTEATALKNASAIGYCNAMQDICDLTFEELETEFGDE